MWRAILIGFTCVFSASSASLRERADLGLKVASDLRVSIYADGELVENSYSSTIDARGRLVVSGPGYIRILHDTDNDGKADKATLFHETRTGAMGMCFDGQKLLYMADGAIWEVTDLNGDDRADGPAQRVLKVATGEHGGHALRKGPDGWWYFIGGNDAGFTIDHQAGSSYPLMGSPQGGALLRFSTNYEQRAFIVQGMRNAYDFDFNGAGDIFTYDSDVERDYLLPWYTPTRIYHLAFGGHHGWRLPGYLRSWKSQDYYPDIAEAMTLVGRGSPTGVTVYRHQTLPERYHGGLFALDWTFGKVWFVPLKPKGGSYAGEGEVVIEPIGSEGFAPNDVTVAPNGDLFISIGGRKTRGAVYRVSAAEPSRSPRPGFASDLEEALAAPQPLDAWSRAKWLPVAQRAGATELLDATVNEKLPTSSRVRAIEAHRELFGDLPDDLLRTQMPAEVKARALWASGKDSVDLVWRHTANDEPMIARAAFERLQLLNLENIRPTVDGENVPWLLKALDSSDSRVALHAWSYALRVDPPAFRRMWPPPGSVSIQGKLALAALFLFRGEEPRHEGFAAAFKALETGVDSDSALRALRLFMLAGGDWNLHKPSVEIYTAYELTDPSKIAAPGRERALAFARPQLSSESSDVKLEASRLLAMLDDSAPETLAKISSFLGPHLSPLDDFHYLIVLSKLNAPWPEELAGKVATSIIGLEQKLGGREHRLKQNWAVRRNELVEVLIKREPKVGGELIQNDQFFTPGHVPVSLKLPRLHREEAAQKFLAKVKSDSGFAWSPSLVELLGQIPETHELLRKQTHQFALRDTLTLTLSRDPKPNDRKLFYAALAGGSQAVAEAALQALNKLPFEASSDERAALGKALRRSNEKAIDWRKALVVRALLQLPGTPTADSANIAALIKALIPPADTSVSAELSHELAKVNLEAGDITRGATIYKERACDSCHGGAGAIGPDLAGIAARLSAKDLFQSIADPNENVSEAYQAHAFELRDGQTQVGMVAFESADGVIIQTGPGVTMRIDNENIASRRPDDVSLMPTGLLDGFRARDLADLYAYMKSVTK